MITPSPPALNSNENTSCQLGLSSNLLFPVIPLEDLPELQVGFGFGVASKDKAKKPAYLKVSYSCIL